MDSPATPSAFLSRAADTTEELGSAERGVPGSRRLLRRGRWAPSRLRALALLGSFALLSWAWSSAPAVLTRGAYLQSVTSRSATVVCRTDTAGAVTLRYGRHAGPPWDFETSSPSGLVHVFALNGLRPETRYAYELTAGSTVLARGEPYYFRTAPPENSRAPFRFLAWGDSGTGTSAQLDVANRMEEVVPVPHFALGLGDLVYEDGDWNDYDPKLFTPYRDLFPHVTFWPTLGNHDVATENGAPYFDAFYLPTSTGAPGHPSNTERYYSFDHGMAHFTCLDSELSSSSPGSAMYEWLEDDLADARARGRRWLIVFLHRPVYSRGTHDSDSESSLIRLRENLVPLLESYDVDLVAAGHSHNYERSYLAKDDAILQSHTSDYTKVASPDGTMYLVSGCGGKTGSGSLDHPLMARSYGDVAGFSLIDVSWEELRGTFVERDGETTDIFTVHKTNDAIGPRIAALAALDVDDVALVFDEPVKDGTGASGAENLANYVIQPARAVLGATLQSDQRTVLLRTSSLPTNRGHQLSVAGVQDVAGNSVEPTERGWFVLPAAAAGPPLAVLSTEVHTANVPAAIAFSSARSTDAASVRWDFGDGTPVVQGSAVEHLYGDTGLYTAHVIVADAAGNESVGRLPIRIHDQGSAPVANVFAAPLAAAAGETVTFGSGGSLDPDGGALFVSWDFGDPASGAANRSQLASPSHVYATAGSYTVVLTVVDDEGSAVTDSAQIDVGGGGPPPSGTTFPAVADAQVRSSSASGNYGSDPALRLRAGSPEYRSFVRFQVSGLTGSVTSATLRLFVTDDSDDGGSAYAVDTSWTEGGITWSNAPALAGLALDSAGAVSAGTWAEYDVTAHVSGDGSFAFGLVSASENSTYFSAREGANPPQLVIAVGGPPQDTTPPQVTARNPAPGASSVVATIHATATFDEPVQGVGGSTFVLRQGTTSVAAQVSYDAATRTAVLDPSSSLAAGATYTASLTSGIRDLAGNALTALSWSFTVAAAPPPASSIFPVGADAHVVSNSRNGNFGTDPTLRVRDGSPEYRSYLGFQVSGLTGSVTSATLRLFVTEASDDGGSVFGVDTAWTESGITWRNAPLIEGNSLDSAGAVSAGTWVEYDVTAHVGGNGSFAFGLTSASVDSAFFSAREGSNPPQLLILASSP